MIGGNGKQGLMSGSAELREQAAEGLGELIDVTSEAALKPFVVPITGYVTQTQPELCGHFNITKSLYISLCLNGSSCLMTTVITAIAGP